MTPGTANPVDPRWRWMQWLKLFLALCFLLLLTAYFVVAPLVDRVLNGLGTVAGSVFQGLSELVHAAHADACFRIEQSPAAQLLFGEPVQCAPIEDVTWLETKQTDAIVFEFNVSGPRGPGRARVTAVNGQTSLRIAQIVLIGPGGSAVLLWCP